jgi:hypothetical protein
MADVFDGPVIFSSGHALKHEIERLLENPRAAFLMKPYPPRNCCASSMNCWTPIGIRDEPKRMDRRGHDE